METFSIRIKGKLTKVPSCQIGSQVIVASGKWIRLAQVHDEEWKECEPVQEPEFFMAGLKKKLRADVFTFFQMPPASDPKFPYHYDWDNFAVIHITTFDDWWQSLPQEARKNTRRSAKRGVIVRTAQLDDEFVRGVTEIYNETPFRQGKAFPHYGKDFATIKEEMSTLLDHSEFIGAYFGDELIGFIKIVYMGERASILHIVSKCSHYDKRPSNALIARAVEICSQKRVSYLLYGRYIYGRKTKSPLIDFKRRSGFEEMKVPRYYVPLTLKGRIIVRLRLYRGVLGLLPSGFVNFVVNARAAFIKWTSPKPGPSTGSADGEANRNLEERELGSEKEAEMVDKANQSLHY